MCVYVSPGGFVGATEPFLRFRKFLFFFLLGKSTASCDSWGARNTNSLSSVEGVVLAWPWVGLMGGGGGGELHAASGASVCAACCVRTSMSSATDDWFRAAAVSGLCSSTSIGGRCFEARGGAMGLNSFSQISCLFTWSLGKCNEKRLLSTVYKYWNI